MKTSKKILILVAIIICLLVAVGVYMIYGNTGKKIKNLIAPAGKQITSIEIAQRRVNTVTSTDTVFVESLVSKLMNSSRTLTPCKDINNIWIKLCYSDGTRFCINTYEHNNMFSLEGTGGERLMLYYTSKEDINKYIKEHIK